MRSYNEQIEGAYVSSKRQGDMMRNRLIERSSGQDRRNRYRDDRYQYTESHPPYDQHYRGEGDRVDRYGYEQSALRNSEFAQQQRMEEESVYGHYPETYRSAMTGYMGEHVGKDLGRKDYNQTGFTQNRGLHRGKGPKNYKRSDERIREDILDRLTDDPYIDPSDIEVTVSACEVTLSGTINDRSQKRRAEDIAEAVSGVKNVENRLKIEPVAVV